jgi:hypothetical protein
MPSMGISGGGGTDVSSLAQEATLQQALTELQTLNTVDFATETTQAAVLAELQKFGFAPKEYDEVALTYVGIGLDGEGQVATAVYKLATVTVATLTLSYDASDRLVGVVRT